MKVLMVNTELTRGGAARMAATLAKGLIELDDQPNVTLVHCQNNETVAPFMGIKKPFSRQMNALIARGLGSGYAFDFGVADQVIDMAKNADVLHIHNIHGYYLNYRKLLQECSEMPIIWTWHDMWGATGRCGFSHECDGWKSGCNSCGYKEYYPAAWIDRAAHEYQVKSNLYSKLKNLRIVSPSQWLADIAIERGFSNDQVSVIPNPVDLSSYYPKEVAPLRTKLGIDANAFYALFVAADCNDPRKGYVDYEKAIEGAGVKGIAVGVPPTNKSSNIHYVGALNSAEELSDWYAAADVMVITSKADNYPNTVIESLACGTPVCGYAVGGVPTQVQEDWSYLVEPGEVEGLANQINVLANAGQIGDGVSYKLSDYAKGKWNPVGVARKYMKIYKGITGAV